MPDLKKFGLLKGKKMEHAYEIDTKRWNIIIEGTIKNTFKAKTAHGAKRIATKCVSMAQKSKWESIETGYPAITYEREAQNGKMITLQQLKKEMED